MSLDLSASTTAVRHSRQLWWMGYLVVVAGGLVIAAFARRRITEPWIGLTLGLFLLVLLGWLIRPRIALYVTIGLTAVSDLVTVGWFPFVKNFSSRESIGYISDALTISPLEVSLAVGLAVTGIRQYAATGRVVAPSPMLRPILLFSALVFYGFARGIIMRGSDIRISVLEGRSLFYLLIVFAIATNVCTEAKHLRSAMWWLLGGVLVQSLLSLQFFLSLDPAERADADSLNEHGSALGQNLLILGVLSLLLFRARAAKERLLLLAALVPTCIVYLIAQRRAGVAALSIGILMLLALLYWRRRRRFWVVAPLTGLITTAYLGAFWNNQSMVGFPAQAIKSIIAPGAASATDQDSDLYRLIESFDLWFTIRTDPLLGLGFGQPFYRPIPLPEISFFELSAYLPHNSLLWFWIKTGFVGFAVLFYMIGKMVMMGTHRARRLPDGVDVTVAQLGLLFVVMFTVYTYVDISWDARNMVFLGLAATICAFSPPQEVERGQSATVRTVGSEIASETTAESVSA